MSEIAESAMKSFWDKVEKRNNLHGHKKKSETSPKFKRLDYSTDQSAWMDPPERAYDLARMDQVVYGRTVQEWIDLVQAQPGRWLRLTPRGGQPGSITGAFRLAGLETRQVLNGVSEGFYIRRRPLH